MKRIFTVLTFHLFIATNVLSEYSLEDCKSLGFNKVNLVWSTCKYFPKYDMNEIYDNCVECCTKDEDDNSTKRYPKAVLEVCTCKFGAYPQIQAFIKSDRPSKYNNLQIRYVRGLDPIIKLYNEDNRVEDELDIRKWDTDSVDEFLETHLSKD